jgi:chromosome segregation ATPase
MPIFQTRRDYVEQLAAKDARIAELESELEASLALNAEAAEREQAAAEAMQELRAEATQLADDLAATTAERDSAEATRIDLEAKVTELTMAANATAERVSVEASRQLASMGHQPVDLEGPAGEGAATNILDRLASLSGGERTCFYNENRKAIMAAIRKG